MSDQIALNITDNDLQVVKRSKCNLTVIWLGLISFVIISLCIFLPPSFVYVEYNEMAFDRDKFGIVDTSRVITHGRHFLSLTHVLVTFPTTFNVVSFLEEQNTSLSIFTLDGYQIKINLQFYYRLLSSELKKVYDMYSKNIELGVINLAKLAIRELAGSATSGVYLPLQEYITNRTYIERRFAERVSHLMREQLSIDMPVEYFKIIELIIPQDMIDRYQTTVIQLQDNEVRENTQLVATIQAETAKMVSVIDASTSNILQTAKIQSNFIRSNANITANNIINNANTAGFANLCSVLNITNSTDIIRLSKILNLMENPATKLFFNIGNNIIIQ